MRKHCFKLFGLKPLVALPQVGNIILILIDWYEFRHISWYLLKDLLELIQFFCKSEILIKEINKYQLCHKSALNSFMRTSAQIAKMTTMTLVPKP